MRRLIAIGVVLVLIVVFGVLQLILPGLAASRLRDQLGKRGHVLSVEVSAFPAIELLWHHADSVNVRMSDYRAATGNALGSQLGQAGDVGTLTATVGVLRAGLLTVRNATLHKHGSSLSASAQVDEADLRSALPILSSVQAVGSGNGTLTLRGTATLLGVTATVDVTAAARSGAIAVAPDVPFGSALTITAFDDPHVYVNSLSAEPDAGGFSVSATGRLR